MVLKDFGDLFATLIPTGVRDKFNAGPFALVLGQALLLLLFVAAYLGIVVLINNTLSDDLADLQTSLGPIWFWLLLTVPVALILLALLPGMARAIRAARLQKITINTTNQSRDTFRLYPYGPADKDRFSRTDGADRRALDWLRGTGRTLLYLSGASGTGKSSLIGAAILPTLESEGWATLTLRVDNDPSAQLGAALRARADLFDKVPGPTTGLRTLLERAAGRRTGKPPLLIVIDQFEELLILNDATARQPLIDLLRSLETEPISGLRLLCVFRSDYRELLFQQDLPDYRPRENAFELSPFVEKDARAFLASSGLKLSPDAETRLLRGLDRIEEARGLYRPITLNMVGFVLERSGATLRDDPERLIESYLRGCLSTGPARDHAASVLGRMITEAGTKEPRDLPGLSVETGLPLWQVEAVLTQLELDGLVRRLADNRWEISHDFIARLLGILIGRLRPPLWRRAAPIALPLATAGWSAALFVTAFWLPDHQQNTARAELRRLNLLEVTLMQQDQPQEWITCLCNVLTDKDLLRFSEIFLRLNIKNLALNISNADKITSLEPLRELPIHNLVLRSADGIMSLEPLGKMPLESLDLSDSTGITDLDPLKGLQLTSLILTNASGIKNLDALKGMPIRYLYLSNLDGISSVEALQDMPLEKLDLTDADGITNLAPLKGIDPNIIVGASDSLLTTLTK